MAYSKEGLIKTSRQVACHLGNFGIHRSTLAKPIEEFILAVASIPGNAALTMFFLQDPDRTRSDLLSAVSHMPVDPSRWGQAFSKQWVEQVQLTQAYHRQLKVALEPDLLCSLATPPAGELHSEADARRRIQPGGIYRAWPYTKYELLTFLDLRP